MTRKAIAVDGWAGLQHYPCEVIGETRTRYRVRIIERPANLPQRRAEVGAVVLVPKYSVVEAR